MRPGHPARPTKGSSTDATGALGFFSDRDRCGVDPADGMPEQPRPDVRHAAFGRSRAVAGRSRATTPAPRESMKQLAAQNSGTQQNAFLLLAAREYLRARQADDAQRVLASIAPPLTPDQTFEKQMLGVELALARSQTQQAWQQLAAIAEPRTVRRRRALSRIEGARRVRRRPARRCGARRDGARALAGEQPGTQRSAARSAALAARRQRARHQDRAAHRRGSRGPRLARAGLAGGLGRAAVPPRPRRRSKRGALAIRTIRPTRPCESSCSACEVGPAERVAHIALLLPLSGRAAAPRPSACAKDS